MFWFCRISEVVGFLVDLYIYEIEMKILNVKPTRHHIYYPAYAFIHLIRLFQFIDNRERVCSHQTKCQPNGIWIKASGYHIMTCDTKFQQK